jgi:tetratricopeptide (TPR) repeat protein
LRDKFPDDIEPHLLLGIALMRDTKYDKSRRVTLNALTKFPNDWQLHELMGHVLGHLNRLAEAEKHFRLAIENASYTDEEEKAMLYFHLADILWEQSKRDEAIANWKLALEIDPDCIVIFNDVLHFQNIHLKRYFALVGRDEFRNEDEAKSVIGVTMNGWNQFVAPRARDIDNLTTEERTAFFKSITLDFKDVVLKWKNT